MACYAPRKAYRTTTGLSFYESSRNDNLGSIDLPCRQCIGCRLDRAHEWTIRIMHEAQLHHDNAFVTLTYKEEARPKGLNHQDFQKFIRALRKQQKKEIRYYMCGEYTPQNNYPHFHACLFGVTFPDAKNWKQNDDGRWIQTSDILDKCWKRGFTTVGELNQTTANYCARYIIQKGDEHAAKYLTVDADGVITRLPREYNRMSLKPGIGALWYNRHKNDLYAFDYAIDSRGHKHRVPTYYDKLHERSGADIDQIQYQRQLRGQAQSANNTDDRLLTRHIVHKARIRALKRREL